MKNKLNEILERITKLEEKLERLFEMMYWKPTITEEELLREYLFGEVKND